MTSARWHALRDGLVAFRRPVLGADKRLSARLSEGPKIRTAAARAFTLLLALLLAHPAHSQGFAGLGQTAEGFAIPRPDRPFAFPIDHGAHPDYRIEWWYVTANLETASGEPRGIQWTLFRSALEPRRGEGWESPQIWMGHAALTMPATHRYAELFARDGIGQAGVEPQPFAAWIDDWEMAGPTLSDVTLRANGEDFSYDLQLSATGPFVPQGERGYSVKSQDGQASYYYSQPFYEVTGTITLDGVTEEVTGTAWLDREWSSQLLSEDQTGWDWFSLNLDDGTRVMAFQLRGARGAYNSGTWIRPDGTPRPLPPEALRFTPLEMAEVAGRDVPVRWRVEIPEEGLDVEVDALNPQSWMGTLFSYWEGPVRIEGSHAGRGYLEMTGYE